MDSFDIVTWVDFGVETTFLDIPIAFVPHYSYIIIFKNFYKKKTKLLPLMWIW
jgi:hypothetical protein